MGAEPIAQRHCGAEAPPVQSEHLFVVVVDDVDTPVAAAPCTAAVFIVDHGVVQ